MGLLDELRQKTEKLQEQEQRERERREHAEAVYRDVIKPALQKLYSTFSELTKHLNYVKPDIKVPYTLNKDGLVLELNQENYRIAVDSANETREVDIYFECVYPKPIQFVLREKTKMDDTLQYLKSTNLKYQVSPYKNEHHETVGGQFVIHPVIKVNLTFKADIDNSLIQVRCANYYGFGVRKHALQPDKFTDEYMDQLGRFLIRELDIFKVDVSDDVKEKLRAQIAEEQRARQSELEEAEKERLEEEERKRNGEGGGRFQFLKKFNVPKTG